MILQRAGCYALNTFSVRQDYAQPQVRKVFSKCLKCRPHIGVGRYQNDLLNTLIMGLRGLFDGHAIHAQGNIHVRFFFFELPDGYLVLPRRRSVWTDITGGFGWIQLMPASDNFDTLNLQHADASVLCLLRQ